MALTVTLRLQGLGWRHPSVRSTRTTNRRCSALRVGSQCPLSNLIRKGVDTATRKLSEPDIGKSPAHCVKGCACHLARFNGGYHEPDGVGAPLETSVLLQDLDRPFWAHADSVMSGVRHGIEGVTRGR